MWQWRNDNPYGNNLAQGTIEFNLRFAGQYFDAESGLHYNIHRTYNPEIGRYMQSDPMGLAAGSNTYNYVGRNPFDGVDPLGLDKENYLNSLDLNNPAAFFAKDWKNSLRVITHANSDTQGWYHYAGGSVNSTRFGQILADTEYLKNRLKNNLPALIILDACETAKRDSIPQIYESIIKKNENYKNIPIYIVGATHEVRGFLWNYDSQWSYKSEFPYIEFGDWKVFLNGKYDPARNLSNPNKSNFNPTGGVINVK